MRLALVGPIHWLGQRVSAWRLLLELGVAVWALYQVSILYSVFFARLTYPMDLEWMEGGTLYEAFRVLHGDPLYVKPVTTWAPYPYPPVQPWLLAIVGFIHLDFWSGRIVSIFFFSLLCFVIFHEIFVHLKRSAYGIAVGALAVATIVNSYPVVGQWYDLIRCDTMMLGLWAAGAARLMKCNATWRHTLWTAVLFTLAVYTKQTAAMFVAWSCLFLIVHQPRLGLRLAFLTGSFCLLLLLLLQWSTGGAFWYLTIGSLGQHEMKPAMMYEALKTVYDYAPFFVVTPFILLLSALKGWVSPRAIHWAGSFLVAIPVAIIAYSKVGAYLNALVPLIVLASPAIIFVCSDILQRTGASFAALRWAMLVGLVYFVSTKPLVPKDYIPDAAKWRAARELNSIVASLKGGVVCTYLGFLPAHNGHDNPHWQSMVVWDSIWRNEPMNEPAAFDHSGAHWALTNSQDTGPLANHIRSVSKLAMRIPDSARVRMQTGAGIEIDELWERKSPSR
jgi:hypothetical protein